MESLIAALEATREPSRDLDAEIFIHTTPGVLEAGRVDRDGGVVGWWPKNSGYQSAREVPRYTASIEAALTLVPAGAEFELSTLYGIASAGLPLNSALDDIQYVRREDGNLILALCTAALKARANANASSE